MNFKKLLAFTFASLAMGNVASIAQITPIDQCNVKDMTMCGSDLYVATNEGYLIFDTKVGETKEMKTVGNLTSIIAKDQTDLWYIANLGRSSTINHVKGAETTTYSVANGAIKGGPYADVGAKGLAYGPNNTVWFGAYGFFHKFDGKEWTNYTCPASNFGRIYYKSFAFDSNGTVWVAGNDQQKNATFGEFDPVKGEQTPVACDFADNGVNSMFVDANDNVWIGTDSKGFYKYDGSTFVNYNKDSDANIDVTIKTNATVGLCQAANGDIYYAFNKSLVCFSGDYMVVAGTVANEDHPRDIITCLLPYGEYIFIGTEQTGVHCYNTTTGEITQVADGTPVVSAISNVNTDKAKTSNAIYDLSGRQTKNLLKGQIYIQNGQKFFNK